MVTPMADASLLTLVVPKRRVHSGQRSNPRIPYMSIWSHPYPLGADLCGYDQIMCVRSKLKIALTLLDNIPCFKSLAEG
jgi:hypothetical protein